MIWFNKNIYSYFVFYSFGLQLQSNSLDSYSVPPADSFAPDFHRKPSLSFSPPSYSPPPSFSAPSFSSPNFSPPNSFPYTIQSHNAGQHGSSQHGLSQHGSFGFKQYPAHANSPRHPIPFRQPVPQGLFESIGQSVQHQDSFGVKLRPQQTVYLPPPITNEIPPAPPGLFYYI